MENYCQRTWDGVQIAQELCKFVSFQLSQVKISDVDKVSYIHWLQMAREIAGENCKEIHATYASLVYQLSYKQPQLLTELAKKDAELYQEIVAPSWRFTRKLRLTDEDHATILAKYPVVLQGDKRVYFVKILNNLTLQAKLLFLIEFAKKGEDITCLSILSKDFFGEKFIAALSKAIQKNDSLILERLDILVAQAPADTVALLRKLLVKVFVAYDEKIFNQPANEVFSFLQEFSLNREYSKNNHLTYLGFPYYAALIRATVFYIVIKMIIPYSFRIHQCRLHYLSLHGLIKHFEPFLYWLLSRPK